MRKARGRGRVVRESHTSRAISRTFVKMNLNASGALYRNFREAATVALRTDLNHTRGGGQP